MIPLVDLRAQYLDIKADIDAAIARVFESGQFVLGDEVAGFEREFAAYSGASEGIAVNTGTSALHLALIAAGVRAGDEVITTPFTFVATVAAIGYIGAKAVFVDIDPKTFTIDPAHIEPAITSRTKAIVPVHLYGQPADMDPILAVARRHGLVVIEDACQAHGAAYSGATEGIAVNTGTSALHLALIAAGVRAGDEVITTPFTFVATVAAIGYIGAKAVFVDIDPQTFTIDPAQIEQAITSRTKAIVPVHLYGQPADMDPILATARRHGLVVIEDACQAHGAAYKGRPVGSLGHAAAFSFYPGKNLGAYGEGGMVVSSSESFAREVRMLRDWGAEKKYLHVLKGFNYRMEGLQGAMLRVKLRHLERWTEARRAHARDYAQLLVDAGVGIPAEADFARHVFHVYAVRTGDRQSLQRTLQANGVATGIHYPIPVHLQPAYSDLGYKAGQFPEAERAANEVLSLPMYPELSRTKLEMVAAAIRQEAYVG